MDASKFSFKQKVKLSEFEILLIKTVARYKLMLQDSILLPNDENDIRDKLLSYFDDETDFVLNAEPKENKGFVDIKIHPINPFVSQKAYYIIECKRLNNHAKRGTSGLNYKYIKDGILRFITSYYSSFYKTNAMIGFIVENMDIHSNIEDINFLLSNCTESYTNSEIKKENFIIDFEYHYSSTHQIINNSDFKLYHLMFDFSSCIAQGMNS